ncbi:hypothetical protein [Rhodococcus artemisiae]|uniref:Uncharacterized protein n=1 Tax=Rhodococcus artemisiae TaxID=714159 RepID=A0ABU7LGT1_9NOCA|nr:hypothetical protein [Rhodococcus artemisiae]MEE2060117.1 hypothetical protein [Rhodococcus artemisiae]
MTTRMTLADLLAALRGPADCEFAVCRDDAVDVGQTGVWGGREFSRGGTIR